MNRSMCHRLRETVLHGSGSSTTAKDSLDDELIRHAETCRACSEELRVAGWLRSVAEADVTSPAPGTPAAESLPSASQLWWKAEIIRRLTEREALVERAVRPVRWFQWAGLGLASVVLSLVAAWVLSRFSGELSFDIQLADGGWQLLIGLLTAGTVLPMVGFGAVWLLLRQS